MPKSLPPAAHLLPRNVLRTKAMKQEWPLWEVFIRSKNGLAHRHAGSVHAADA